MLRNMRLSVSICNILLSYQKKGLNGKPALSYAHCEGKKETVSSSHHVKFAIQPKMFSLIITYVRRLPYLSKYKAKPEHKIHLEISLEPYTDNPDIQIVLCQNTCPKTRETWEGVCEFNMRLAQVEFTAGCILGPALGQIQLSIQHRELSDRRLLIWAIIEDIPLLGDTVNLTSLLQSRQEIKRMRNGSKWHCLSLASIYDQASAWLLFMIRPHLIDRDRALARRKPRHFNGSG